jgi:hypothetical protein
MNETIEYKGYQIQIEQDSDAKNPFEAWDCEPPLLTYYGGRHGYAKYYNGAPETWGAILRLLPDSCFARGERVEFIREHLNCSLREFADAARDFGNFSEHCSPEWIREVCAEILRTDLGSKPDSWRDAIAWMDAAEAILVWGGITAVYAQSTGYCQGDATLCLAVATPEWVKKVGAPADSLKRQLESAIELYGAWAWGDVYGCRILDEEGNELGDVGSSVWGFYGADHEKSGLLESARDAIESHIAKQADEAQSLEDAFAFA